MIENWESIEMKSSEICERLRHNFILIHNSFLKEIDEGLQNVREKIVLKYPQSLQNLAVKTLYRLLIKGKLKNNAMNEIDFILNLICNFNSFEEVDEKIDEIIEKHYKKYKKMEFTRKYLKRDHPKYLEIRRIMKADFRSRILNFSKLMFAEGSNYKELVISAYGNKKSAEDALENHLITVDKVIDIIEHNRSIIKIPIYNSVYLAKDIEIMRYGYEYALQIIHQKMEAFFNIE